MVINAGRTRDGSVAAMTLLKNTLDITCELQECFKEKRGDKKTLCYGCYGAYNEEKSLEYISC